MYPDVHPDEITPAAGEEVDILLNRAMILRPEPGWVLLIAFLPPRTQAFSSEEFGVWDFETPFRRMHRGSGNGIEHHLAYIDRLKKSWQLDPREKIGFPETWFVSCVTHLKLCRH